MFPDFLEEIVYNSRHSQHFGTVFKYEHFLKKGVGVSAVSGFGKVFVLTNSENLL